MNRFAQFVRAAGMAMLLVLAVSVRGAESALVFQTDFGLKDGAVAAMKGVAFSISPTLKQFDLTHEIPAYNIWEAAYRLKQTAPFWPAGTVFVSVVDPGVGSERKPVVAKTKSGHYFVTPDNGTLTFIPEDLGIEELREIDTTRHRRAGSAASHTFHGRDIFALTGAELASGKTAFSDVGPKLGAPVLISYSHPELKDGALIGCVPVLDIQYGNVWSNIDKRLFDQLDPHYGDEFEVKIFQRERAVFSGKMPYEKSFSSVERDCPLLYLNSLMAVAFGLNQGDFAKAHGIRAGPEWRVEIKKILRKKNADTK